MRNKHYVYSLFFILNLITYIIRTNIIASNVLEIFIKIFFFFFIICFTFIITVITDVRATCFVWSCGFSLFKYCEWINGQESTKKVQLRFHRISVWPIPNLITIFHYFLYNKNILSVIKKKRRSTRHVDRCVLNDRRKMMKSSYSEIKQSIISRTKKSSSPETLWHVCEKPPRSIQINICQQLYVAFWNL